ncbi:C6 transcription factor [Penicillium cf. viridicatum]|uniref:C6 transcription factor n=1 Tax=Penicillium cf. viridicatum TaxID=2972119 RepID=A0A9W9MXS8_9EURO|nr:C6 transcription factor [Penicillium cf. viridicatum]
MGTLHQNLDLATKERNTKRTPNACLQCKQKKKRCDGNSPKCSPCDERSLNCTYIRVKRRGQGKSKTYLEQLEARLAELESSYPDPVESGDKKAGAGSQLVKDSYSPRRSITEYTLGNPTPRPPPDRNVGHIEHSAHLAYTKPVAADVQTACWQEAINSDMISRPVISPVLPSGQDQLRVKEKDFAALPERQAADSFESAPNFSPFKGSVFIQLPPKFQIESMFQIAFDEINYTLPLFDTQVLTSLIEEHYADPHSSPSKQPARWAMINSALAVAIQWRSAPDSQNEMTKLSWGFFKNAFSMFSPIAIRGADVLALEALLAMAFFLQGFSDTRTRSILVCTAVSLSLALGLHRDSYYANLDPAIAERSRRAFWISFTLDKEISTTGSTSIYHDDVAKLDFYERTLTGPSTDSLGFGREISSVLFRSRAELAINSNFMEKQLYFEPASSQNISRLREVVVEIKHRLEAWKEKLPSLFRPGHTNWAEVPHMATESLMILHFSYYQALISLHGFAIRLERMNAHSEPEISRYFQMSAASQMIHLLDYLPHQQPGRLWSILCYPLSACITLLADVLKNPKDVLALSHISSISHLVKVLTRIDRDSTYGIQGFLVLCRELEIQALSAISQMPTTTDFKGLPDSGASALQEQRTSISTCEYRQESSIRVAHGLMGNIPSLRSTAFEFFSGLIPKWHAYIFASELAPPLLVPENYGFTFA